jgi:hypothetical protein
LPALSRFFISNERVLDCYSSRDLLWAITLSGAVEGGSVKSFTGIVELIEHAPKARRWPGMAHNHQGFTAARASDQKLLV